MQKTIFFLIWKFFWLTAETKIDKTNKLNFLEGLSPYQGKLFHLSSFIRQPVVLSDGIFLGEQVTILGELFPNERLSQTNGFNPSIKILIINGRFHRWKRMIDSSCSISSYGKFFLLRLLFPFMELSIYCKNYSADVAKNVLPFFHLHC